MEKKMDKEIIKTPGKKGRIVKPKDATQNTNRKILDQPIVVGSDRDKPPMKNTHKPSKAELLAGGPSYAKLNWYYPGGREAFPFKPHLQIVQYCFPYATEGQLLVDEPKFEHELQELVEHKLPLMKQLKFRYAIIFKGETVHVVG